LNSILIEKSIELRFGFANVRIVDRDLKATFKPGFGGSLNDKEFEGKMRKSDTETSQHWKQTYSEKWAKSSLSKLMKKRPHSPLVKTLADKTQALKLMSLDMASSGVLVPRASLKDKEAKPLIEPKVVTVEPGKAKEPAEPPKKK
jgi:hypothetical protein